MKTRTSVVFIVLATLMSFNVFASSQYKHKYHAANYKVTITNVTKGISFTPFLAATHNRKINLFTIGEVASFEVSRVAEGGDISGLNAVLDQSDNVLATESSAGLLAPGQSVMLKIKGSKNFRKLSLISMLLPTNDTMVALRGAKLPRRGKVTYFMKAYDGGSETNDEYCANIPGPQCGGIPFSPDDDGEGYVYPSPGIHGHGDLSTLDYQWDGPVAKVVVERVY
ncbi:spondin domain-containing protein [Aliikangiella coralliicola]|uniref:Spondin domain-containing protein n=1 Tax=Aliikangiella coralliicola TaxID=2592383 RepID=A0A545UJT4_9GAMM|nr:spondin domain-containing protein [Aliikangiella coralliicola]TQV89726.1 hypothetical protein FLL46_02270 [Aliikangiella coralliicola]